MIVVDLGPYKISIVHDVENGSYIGRVLNYNNKVFKMDTFSELIAEMELSLLWNNERNEENESKV